MSGGAAQKFNKKGVKCGRRSGGLGDLLKPLKNFHNDRYATKPAVLMARGFVAPLRYFLTKPIESSRSTVCADCVAEHASILARYSAGWAA